MKLTKIAAALLGAATLTMFSASALAVPITILVGPPAPTPTDNVLFNNATLPGSGLLVQGDFNTNSDGAGYLVNFTSSSGSKLLVGNGGQATIGGGVGNDPLQNLTFSLDAGATFGIASFNPDVTDDGTITILVNYLSANGLQFSESYDVDKNGQNVFGVVTGDGARITSISLTTNTALIANVSQIRIGDFARAQGVPDGGSTLMFMGLAMVGFGSVRRFIGV